MDATIIQAPCSTKNKTGTRDPEMHQTKKGNLWHFGLKAHLGVDARIGLTLSLETTAANEHDLNQAEHLRHGDEAYVFSDGAMLESTSGMYSNTEKPNGMLRSDLIGLRRKENVPRSTNSRNVSS